MKISMTRVLLQLALIALLAAGGSPRAIAHDLPADRTPFANCFHDCLGTTAIGEAESAPAQPISPQKFTANSLPAGFEKLDRCLTAILAPAAAYVQQLPTPWSADMRRSFASVKSPVRVKALRSLPVERPAQGQPPRPEKMSESLASLRPQLPIPVAAPEHGRAPRPRRSGLTDAHLASRSLAKRQPFDGYRPYDWDCGPWHCGQFSLYENLESPSLQSTIAAPTAPLLTPVPNPPASVSSCQRVAELLQHVEHWQCLAAEELASLRSVQRVASQAREQQWILQARLNRTIAEGSARLFAQPTRPYFSQPPFIIYESASGKQFALTAAQYKAWTSLSTCTLDEASRRAKVEVDESALRRQVLSGVSRQLERAGNSLLSLSQFLGSLAETRVATGSSPANAEQLH